MTIFLPIKLAATGGTSTFARKLRFGMVGRRHTVVFEEPAAYDILLVTPRCPLKYIWQARKKGVPIVHRLDGVYYPASTAGWLFPLHNAPLQLTRAAANYVIYQSRYSKFCCNRFLGPSRKHHTIIYNGVDTNIFSPLGEKMGLRDNADQHVFITASRFRRPDQIVPLLEAFKLYTKKYHPNSKFVVAGDFSHRGWLDGGPAFAKASAGTAPKRSFARPPKPWRRWMRLEDRHNVTFTGPISNNELPTYLRAADVFLFSHQNPPCPNNVIEAMACGLPICGISDGAMPELVASGTSGELLPVYNRGFLRFRNLDVAAMAANLNTIMKRRDGYATASREQAMKHFSLDEMASRYAAVFKKMAKPVGGDVR